MPADRLPQWAKWLIAFVCAVVKIFHVRLSSIYFFILCDIWRICELFHIHAFRFNETGQWWPWQAIQAETILFGKIWLFSVKLVSIECLEGALKFMSRMFLGYPLLYPVCSHRCWEIIFYTTNIPFIRRTYLIF